MRRFIVATKNKAKLIEIKSVLRDFPLEVISMEEVGLHEDIDECGETFEENALIKAEKIFELSGQAVIADDSGLCVDYLNGAPGIYSARFAGENGTTLERNNKLLGLLRDVPHEKRTARFVCAIAVVFSDTDKFIVTGTLEGYIATNFSGNNGFGYDPLFFVPEYNITMAELTSPQKNKISHRGKALVAMVEELKNRMYI